MKTHFSEVQLADPKIAEANQILGTCQHFGFCTSGCPTYVILHDENDGPRGRIDLIKEMLETGGTPSKKTVEHIDRCLSCMSCMTTCAVKVDYLHLVDTARTYIENNYRRPLVERVCRSFLGFVLSRPALFRPLLGAGRIAVRFNSVLPPALRHVTALVPEKLRDEDEVQSLSSAGVYPAQGPRRWRVALLAGCVQPVLAPHINSATIRLLTRLGCEVVISKSSGCCGALNLHMGKSAASESFAKKNVRAWTAEIDGDGLDAILTNASGCGSTVKDYEHLLRNDASMKAPAKRVAQLAMDICEWLAKLDIPAPPSPRRYRVAYHDACSLRNVQKVTNPPRALLREAGFQVVDIPEAHFCCGSAGTYNMLQPSMAKTLGERKAGNIESINPQIIAAGNIGCITQINLYSQCPIVHTVELLDWAHGGPCPLALQGVALSVLADDEQKTPDAGLEHKVHFSEKSGAENTDMGVW